MAYRKRDMTKSLFIQAITENDHALVKTILNKTKYSHGSYVKDILRMKRELGGFTPLQYVCFQGNSSIASLLINTGNIDINEKGAYDWTALHAAVYSGDFGTVQILLNSCADCFAQDENGTLPINLSRSDQIYQLLKQHMLVKNKNSTYDVTERVKVVRRNRNGRNDSKRTSYYRLSTSYKEDELKILNELSSLRTLKKWKTYTNLHCANEMLQVI